MRPWHRVVQLATACVAVCAFLSHPVQPAGAITSAGGCLPSEVRVASPNGGLICLAPHDPERDEFSSARALAVSVPKPTCTFDGQVIPCTTKSGLWFASHQCYAQQLDPQPDVDDPVWGKKDPADGEIWRCMGYLDAAEHGPARFFVKNDEVPEIFDPEELASEALEQLVLKAPKLRTAPKEVTYVGVETWLWLPRRTWRVKQQTRQEPGISVVVKVKPRSVLWDMGDGNEVECKGPGYPWVKGMLNTANTGCKYSYTDSVGDQEITATITYRVKWTCKGACSSKSGVLEDEYEGDEAGEASISVHEFQTVVVVGSRGRR